MKRLLLSMLAAGVVGVGLMGTEARADHRRSRVGVYVGSGGVSVGVNYGGPRRFYGAYGFYPGYAGYYPAPYRPAPIMAPSCCQYERVYIPGQWDAWGGWHPGYYRTYRVCDHHGRSIAY